MLRFRIPILCLASVLAAAPAVAQERDARVLRPGELRASLGADVFRADQRIDSDIPLAELPELTADVFVPLGEFRDALTAFFESAGAASPPALTAGTPSGDFISSARSVPLSLSLGIVPRVELGVLLPIQRQERLITGLDLTGSQIGLNPAVTSNETLLGSISEAGAAIGGAAFLPTAASPAGIALQQLVQQRTGGALQLPDTALSGPELAVTFPVEPFTNRVTAWQPGDLELFGRFSLIDNLGARYYPSGAGLRYRASVEAAVRLPTGIAPDTTLVLGLGDVTGATGVRLGAAADLFAGTSLWLTAGGSWGRVGAVEAAAVSPVTSTIGGEAVPIAWGAASRFELYAIPRWRLTRELSLGAVTALVGSAGRELTIAEATIEGETSNALRAGLVARYTTFPAYEEGNTPAGVEISVGYTAAVAGSGDQPALGRAFFSIAFFPRLWGERRITPADAE